MNSQNLKQEAAMKDRLLGSSQHPIIIVDQNGYEISKDAHITYAKRLNEVMTEFTDVTGLVIKEEEFNMFLCYDSSRVKNLYSNYVTEKCKNIFPESLRKEHEKEYYRSVGKFFQYFIFKGEAALRTQCAPHFSLNRIRFVEGKATFTEDDADLLLREKFCVDLTMPRFRKILFEFNKLNHEYQNFRTFVMDNFNNYGVDLQRTPLLGQYGSLIVIDPLNSKVMKLNWELFRNNPVIG